MALLTRSRDPARSRAFLHRPGKRGLTASAQSAPGSSGALLRLDQGWQREAMRCYRTIGECWNPAQYQSRAMERIRFFPALYNEKGVPEEVTSGELTDLFRRIQSPSGAPGDLSEIAGLYGRLQFVIGDGLLTVSEDEGQEVWEYLSPMEMRLNPQLGSSPQLRNSQPQEYRRLRAPGTPPEELFEAPDSEFAPLSGDRVHVWRLWRRHPEFSQWADSPIRPVLDLYTLLERLTMAATAEASSRAAQRGGLFVPDELSFGPADPSQDENPEEDPLIKELTESMARAIRNPESAEAMAPFVLRGPGVTTTASGAVPTSDLIKWFALGPTDRYSEGEMWDKVISRIAGAIDMPKELLTGVGDVSHWGQWFLDDIGFRQHTGPTVIRFCNDIASAYLRPAAIEARVANAERVTVWFDASQAINHPDETGTALKAHSQLIISDEAARQKLGFSEDAAPPEDELARRVAIQLKEFPSDLQPEPQTGATPPTQGGRGGDVVQAPPTDSQTRPPGAKPPSPAPNLSAMIVGAAEMQIDRARELAGNKLLRRAQSCVECKDAIKAASPTAPLPPALIASALGPETVREVLGGRDTEASLVRGVGDAFANRLRAWKVDGGWPEQLGQMVEQHALRTLFEPIAPPLPPGFVSACRKAVT